MLFISAETLFITILNFIFQAFVATGTNLQLVFNPVMNGYNVPDLGRECDFDKEMGKV